MLILVYFFSLSFGNVPAGRLSFRLIWSTGMVREGVSPNRRLGLAEGDIFTILVSSALLLIPVPPEVDGPSMLASRLKLVGWKDSLDWEQPGCLPWESLDWPFTGVPLIPWHTFSAKMSSTMELFRSTACHDSSNSVISTMDVTIPRVSSRSSTKSSPLRERTRLVLPTPTSPITVSCIRGTQAFPSSSALLNISTANSPLARTS